MIAYSGFDVKIKNVVLYTETFQVSFNSDKVIL